MWIKPEDMMFDKENRVRAEKIQTATQYARNVISANEECFVAQWVLQNQDKQIDDYTMCYQYCGDTIKFWMGKKQ